MKSGGTQSHALFFHVKHSRKSITSLKLCILGKHADNLQMHLGSGINEHILLKTFKRKWLLSIINY